MWEQTLRKTEQGRQKKVQGKQNPWERSTVVQSIPNISHPFTHIKASHETIKSNYNEWNWANHMCFIWKQTGTGSPLIPKITCTIVFNIHLTKTSLILLNFLSYFLFKLDPTDKVFSNWFPFLFQRGLSTSWGIQNLISLFPWPIYQWCNGTVFPRFGMHHGF